MSKKIEALTMPKWGIEMEEGKLTEWLIEEGSSFSKGDALLVVETDKISNEIEAEFDGLCRKKLVDVDGTYPVGALLAVFASDEITDEEVDQFINDFVPVDSSFQPESAVSEKNLSQPKQLLLKRNQNQVVIYLMHLLKMLIFLPKLGKLQLSLM